MTKLNINTSCVICGTNVFKDSINLDDNQKIMFDLYDKDFYGGALSKIFKKEDCHLLRCDKCKHIQYKKKFSSESLSEMYLAHSTFRKSGLGKPKPPPNIIQIPKWSLNILRTLYNLSKKNPTLLDFGAGFGHWSRAAASLGFNVTAYEPNSSRVHSDIQFINNLHMLKNRKFDVIICNQVLEHALEPNNIVKELSRLCHKHTYVYISVPNVGRLSFKTLISDWPYNGKNNHLLAPFQHIQGFNMNSFLLLMKNNNLKVSIKAQLMLGIFGWLRILSFFIGKTTPRLGTTSLIFKKIL